MELLVAEVRATYAIPRANRGQAAERAGSGRIAIVEIAADVRQPRSKIPDSVHTRAFHVTERLSFHRPPSGDPQLWLMTEPPQTGGHSHPAGPLVRDSSSGRVVSRWYRLR
jgi:hypothetical protein